MWNFLAPPAHKQELPAEKIDSTYKSYRWQVFLGIFIGYAGFYSCVKTSRWPFRSLLSLVLKRVS